MRFLFYNVTTTLFEGGIEVFNRELAAELARLGHEVEIWGGRSSQNLDLPGVKVRTFPYIPRTYFRGWGSRLRKFMERLSFFFFTASSLDRKFDWIIISKPYDALFLVPFRKGRYRLLLNLGGWEYFGGVRPFLKRIEVISACSRFLATRWEKILGRQVEVIYNGVDLQKFSFGPQERKNWFISICRLHKIKNLPLAIRVIRRLPIDCQYFIIGDGPDRARIERSAEKDPRIKLLGTVPHQEIPQWLHRAKLALYPSLGDAFCISAVEAMACGVPVIAANRGGLPEVVGEEGGKVVEPVEEAFLEAIRELLEPECWQHFSRAARHRAERFFSWRRSAETLLTLIQKVDA